MGEKEQETPMQRMQREALEEEAAAGNQPSSSSSVDNMQEEALLEQAAADHALGQRRGFRILLNRYMFDLSTTGGKIVNYTVLLLILLSVFLSMFNTISEVRHSFGEEIAVFQMFVIYVFFVEYILRVYSAGDRKKYVTGFYGIIDLLTVLPVFFGSSGSSIMRLARLVRILKVTQYFPVLATLMRSVSGALQMILAVFATIATVSIFSGNLIYMLEPETFGNAFIGAWWSLVTMSTVGYGDLVPHSVGGMMLGAALIMVGICVVAMMTAVIAVRVGRMVNMNKKCFDCEQTISSEHNYCPHCGQDQSDEIDLFSDDE
ncbi:ion transporter [bacterium AH-315-G11]|nr:ion transporter [bacterium AH-315-G11]